MADADLVKTALDRGYTLDDIADKVSANAGLDPKAIRDRGYSSADILGKFGYQVPEAPKPEPGMLDTASDVLHSMVTPTQSVMDKYSTGKFTGSDPETTSASGDIGGMGARKDYADKTTEQMNRMPLDKVAEIAKNGGVFGEIAKNVVDSRSAPIDVGGESVAPALSKTNSDIVNDVLSAPHAPAEKTSAVKPELMTTDKLADILTPAAGPYPEGKEAVERIGNGWKSLVSLWQNDLAARMTKAGTEAGDPNAEKTAIQSADIIGQAANAYGKGYTAGLLPDIDQSNTMLGSIAHGAGELIGFIKGAPMQVANRLVTPLVEKVGLAPIVNEALIKAIPKAAASQAATLGVAGTVSGITSIVGSPDVETAFDRESKILASNAAMGAVFGVAGKVLPENTIKQFVGRALGINIALDLANGQTPFYDIAGFNDLTNAQKGELMFNRGLNTFFALHGAGKSTGSFFKNGEQLKSEDLQKQQESDIASISKSQSVDEATATAMAFVSRSTNERESLLANLEGNNDVPTIPPSGSGTIAPDNNTAGSTPDLVSTLAGDRQADAATRDGDIALGGGVATGEERTDRRTESVPDRSVDEQGNTVVERRETPEDRRARFDAMPHEQRLDQMESDHQELRTDTLTDMPNERAYNESKKLPVQGSSDIDGMKGVNDVYGHEAGDALIKAKAEAIKKALVAEPGVWAYRLHGDEFALQANTKEEIDRVMQAARKDLMENGFTFTSKDGDIVTKKGIGFSYGTGGTYAKADATLAADKAKRKALGLRTGERDPATEHAGTESSGVGAEKSNGENLPGRESAGAQDVSLSNLTDGINRAHLKNINNEITLANEARFARGQKPLETLRSVDDLKGDAFDLREIPESDLPASVPFAQRLGVRLLAKAFGKRVVYLHDANGKELFFHGAYGESVGLDPNTIYLSAKTGEYSFVRIVGHEIAHALRAQAPEVYAKLEKDISPIIDDHIARKQLFNRDYGTEEDILQNGAEEGSKYREETIADIIGDKLASPKFIFDLALKMKTNEAMQLFRHIKNVTERAVAAFKGSPLSNQTRTAINNMHDSVLTAMAKYKHMIDSGEIEGAKEISTAKNESGFTDREQSAHDAFKHEAETNTDGLINEYIDKNGMLIDSDKIKWLSPDFADDPSLAGAVHKTSSDLSQKIYTRLLESHPDAPVILTAGGGGSGKSEAMPIALRHAGMDAGNTIVFDSTLSKFKSAVQRINEALDGGHKVTIVYTNTHVDKASDFAFTRERVVGIPVLARAHVDASNVLRSLVVKYQDNPNFKVHVINNHGDIKDMHVGTVDNVFNYEYDQVERNLYEKAKRQRSEGRINENVFKTLVRGIEPENEGSGGLVQGEKQGSERPKRLSEKLNDSLKSSSDRVIFEVAPDPNNKPLTEQWNKLTDKKKTEVSFSIAEKIIPKLLKALGAEGEMHQQLGGYMGETNPSFVILLKSGDPDAISKAGGVILSQDMMIAVSEKPFNGGAKTGAVIIKLGNDNPADVYKRIFAGVKEAQGHTTVNGEMLILNNPELGISTKDLAHKIDAALDRKYEIDGKDGVYASFPTKERYGYASENGTHNGLAGGSSIEARIYQLRAEANALLEKELGVKFSRAERERHEPASTARVEPKDVESRYGVARKGSESVLGLHYSQNPRTELAGNKYGTGMRGAEAKRLMNTEDARLKGRVHFYVDEGNGVTPESGVGGYLHASHLDNIYNVAKDPLGIRRESAGDANTMESHILDAGYDGYYAPGAQGKHGVAVLLGDHKVPVDLLGNKDIVQKQTMPAQVRFARKDKEPFYSQLERGIEGASDKVFTTGKQVKAWLESNSGKLGIKKDEIYWTGLGDYLESVGKVTKADVLAFAQNNGVQVKDVILGGDLANARQKARDDLRIAHNNNASPEVLQKLRDARDAAEENYIAVQGDEGNAKFASYQLPGGENYKELLLTLPEREPRNLNDISREMYGKSFSELSDDEANKVATKESSDKRAINFKSSHFDQPNILAHIRFNDRTDAEGKKVLFLEELQSDWGQKGKKEGFVGNATIEKTETGKWLVKTPSGKRFGEYSSEVDAKEAISRAAAFEGKVPPAPFVTDTKSWTFLAMKRMIAYAVYNGFDKIAWANGEQQAARYDLSKQISRVEYFPENKTLRAFDLSGNRALEETVEPDNIEDYVGKDVAKKLLESETVTTGAGHQKHSIEGDGLRVGGEGMKGYYDQIVPQVANEILRKSGGGKVGDVKFTDAAFDGKDEDASLLAKLQRPNAQPGFDITPELRAKVQGEGLPLFSRKEKDHPGAKMIDIASNFTHDLLGSEVMRDIAKHAVPMSTGVAEAQASAQKFINEQRATQYQWGKITQLIKSKFTMEQRKAMFDAADEQNTLMTLGKPTAGKGINALPPEERKVMQQLHQNAQAIWDRARAVGMVEGDGVKFWTPRMAVLIGEDGGFERPSSGEKSSGTEGRNITTTASSMKHRKYLTADETEAAMKGALGDNAMLVRDILTMPTAMAKMEKAIAGRELVNQVKDIGLVTGKEIISSSHDEGFAQINHPAFMTFRPRMTVNEDGKHVPMVDQNGKIVMDKQHMYINKDWEGPLRAVMSTTDGATYAAYMLLKSKAMTAIMVSPMTHNMVIAGRALAYSPAAVLSLKAYFTGNALAHDTALVNRFIKAGLVPMGENRAAMMDVTDIARGIGKQGSWGDPNESWINLAVQKLGNTIKGGAGDTVKERMDKFGDWYHHDLLWKQVGALQLYIANDYSNYLMNKGHPQAAADAIAAHLANRYGGAVARENMSELARKAMNVMLFSRSFNVGNVGQVKDTVFGLPAGLAAKIYADVGKEAGDKAMAAARGKARSALMVDLGMSMLLTSVTASAIGYLVLNQTADDIKNGYIRRLKAMAGNIGDKPLSPASYNPYQVLPTWDNESKKEERIDLGADESGQHEYMRLPTGKVVEDLVGWFMHAPDTFAKKMAPMPKAAWQAVTNDKGYGVPIEDPQGGILQHIGEGLKYVAEAQIPTDTLVTAWDAATGHATALDKHKLAGFATGFTTSHGNPHGPEAAEMYAVEDKIKASKMYVTEAVKRDLKYGKVKEAEEKLQAIGFTAKEITNIINGYENPKEGASKQQRIKFNQHATEEEIRKLDQMGAR